MPGFDMYVKAASSTLKSCVNTIFDIVGKTAMFFCPPFRRHVLAQRAAEEQAEIHDRLYCRYYQLYVGLDPRSKQQFDDVSGRTKIFADPSRMHGEETSTGRRVLDAQLDGVNRLLWVYLKLLYTRSMLERFLFMETSKHSEITKFELDTIKKLNELPKDAVDDLTYKKRKSLEGTLATANVRRENLHRTKENFACVELEVERLEALLTTLSELAVNRHSPEMITREVDAFRLSVESTEQTISDLQAFTGFTAQDVLAPPILSVIPADMRRVAAH